MNNNNKITKQQQNPKEAKKVVQQPKEEKQVMDMTSETDFKTFLQGIAKNMTENLKSKNF
jgi:hypothetical protein